MLDLTSEGTCRTSFDRTPPTVSCVSLSRRRIQRTPSIWFALITARVRMRMLEIMFVIRTNILTSRALA